MNTHMERSKVRIRLWLQLALAVVVTGAFTIDRALGASVWVDDLPKWHEAEPGVWHEGDPGTWVPDETHTEHHPAVIGTTHYGEQGHTEHHDGETDWVDGYWDDYWVDGYYESVWIDGEWIDEPGGYYDGCDFHETFGYWTDGYWEDEWVDGYWDANWVDGYEVEVSGPWDEWVVDEPEHDDYYVISDAYDEVIVDVAAHWDPPPSPGYYDPEPQPGWWEPQGHLEDTPTITSHPSSQTVNVGGSGGSGGSGGTGGSGGSGGPLQLKVHRPN
jgi:uncharacterized membrane protein YgcG